MGCLTGRAACKAPDHILQFKIYLLLSAAHSRAHILLGVAADVYRLFFLYRTHAPISNGISLNLGASAMPPTMIDTELQFLVHWCSGGWDRIEYSLTSLENSEFSFFSNFDGVSYSTILPAHHKKVWILVSLQLGPPITCSGLVFVHSSWVLPSLKTRMRSLSTTV
jgi:hypothetical protein